MSEEDARGGTPPAGRDGDEGPADGESRREFMKKLPYVAPVIQSFMLADTVYGKSDKDGRARGRGRVSKVKKEKKDKGKTAAPPPPPPPSTGSAR